MRRISWVLIFILAAARSGLAADCNGNGVDDGADIDSGTSRDCDADGTPDDCEALPLLLGTVVVRSLPGAAGDLAIGDLNGDGRPDLAVATGLPDVTVFLDPLTGSEGTGNASISAVLGVGCGDLDGDGDLDLTMSRPGDIRLLKNSGAGAFPVRTYVVETGSFLASRIADLDGDGVNDVVAARGDRDAVAVFKGTGDGSFAQAVDVPVNDPGDPTLADLDRDGDVDALVLDGAGALVLLLNGGNGSLAPRPPDPAGGGGLHAFAAGDVDGDGLPDLASLDASRLRVLANAGAAEFSPRSGYAFTAGGGATVTAIGNVDGDGAREIVLARTRPDGTGEYQLLRLLPGGGLESSIAVAAGGPPRSLRLADLNGDAIEELIAPEAGASAVDIMRRDGPRTPPTHPLAFHTTTKSIAEHGDFEPHMSFLADLDGDGRLDLTTHDGEDRVMVLRNQGDGAQGSEVIYTLRDGDEVLAIAPADLDGDGHLDIAAVDELTTNLLVLVNRGDGTFVQTDQSEPTDGRPFFLVAADLDGDGDRDIATANYLAETIGVFRNRGDASFAPQVRVMLGENPIGLVASDFDGDGDRDLAVGEFGESRVSILKNDGNGGFGGRVGYPAGEVNYLSGSDLDGDGDLDLVAARESQSRITTLRAIGGGTFEVAETLEVGQPPRSAIAAELDGDGLPDIITANEDTGTMSILRSLGGGLLGPAAHYKVGQDPRFVAAGDLDGDGDADLVVANHSSFGFTFFFNETLAPPILAPLGRICTALDYFRLAVPPATSGYAELEVPYLAPAEAGTSLLPLTFLPAELDRPVWESLADRFPSRFGGLDAEGYRALVARRATRKYWAGSIVRLRLPGRAYWGFTVLTDAASDPGEEIEAGEAAAVHRMLEAAFLLEPFAYFPDTPGSRARARAWIEPGFPVLIREPPAAFRRGDVDPGGTVNISDVIAILEGLFDQGAIPCQDAADANDDGEVDLSDALKVLFHLFGSIGNLPAPSGACGLDPTDDDLTCLEVPACG